MDVLQVLFLTVKYKAGDTWPEQSVLLLQEPPNAMLVAAGSWAGDYCTSL